MSVCLHVCLFACLSVCMSVCLSRCPSALAITFEPLHIETSFLVIRYIFTISRSSMSIKVIGSRPRSYEKNDNFTYFNMFILCIWLQVINKVKVTHQGEGHIKVKVKYLHPFKFYVGHTLGMRVVCIRLNAFLLFAFFAYIKCKLRLIKETDLCLLDTKYLQTHIWICLIWQNLPD